MAWQRGYKWAMVGHVVAATVCGRPVEATYRRLHVGLSSRSALGGGLSDAREIAQLPALRRPRNRGRREVSESDHAVLPGGYDGGSMCAFQAPQLIAR